jgi:hypothetical protein
VRPPTFSMTYEKVGDTGEVGRLCGASMGLQRQSNTVLSAFLRRSGLGFALVLFGSLPQNGHSQDRPSTFFPSPGSAWLFVANTTDPKNKREYWIDRGSFRRLGDIASVWVLINTHEERRPGTWIGPSFLGYHKVDCRTGYSSITNIKMYGGPNRSLGEIASLPDINDPPHPSDSVGHGVNNAICLYPGSPKAE